MANIYKSDAIASFLAFLQYEVPSLHVHSKLAYSIASFRKSEIAIRSDERKWFLMEFENRFGKTIDGNYSERAANTLLKEYGIIKHDLRGNAIEYKLFDHFSPLYRLQRYSRKIIKNKGRINLASDIVESIIQDMMEENNQQCEIASLELLSYRKLCAFDLTPKILPNIKGYDLLREKGWYHPTNNILGVVKDHRLSVKSGYDQRISPSIIGHPANCEFLPMRVNCSKSSKSSISINELKNDIANSTIWC